MSILTVAEAAERLRFNQDTVRRMARRGDLRASRVGGEWRITEEAVAELLAAHQNVAPERRRRRRGSAA